MSARIVIALLSALLTTSVASERPAHACGGCFAAPDATGSVESHNMVVSLSPTRTILWDQIVYSGNPKDFVWVLPLPTPNATLEVAEQQFFNDLESISAPLVRAPPRLAAPDSAGCGDSEPRGGAVTLAPDAGGSPPVTIYDREVVGPYETVIIGSEDADALQNWLVANNYRVTESVVPTIAYYVARGDVFAVLRLAPGQGVQAMQPIRVQYPGYMARFPLRMVKVGAQIFLELNLLILAAERFEAENYDNVSIEDINTDQLVYDYSDFSSNYDRLFDDLIEDAGGRAWVTEYAGVLNSRPGPDTRDADDLVGTSRGEGEDPPEFDDFDLVFQDNAFPMLTRLRTKMLLSNISDDLVLARSEDNRSVSRLLVAGNSRNDPRGDVRAGGDGDGGCRIDRRTRGHASYVALLLFALLVGFSRRRRRS